MNDVLNTLGLVGIIPVVVIDDKEHAQPLAQALLKGGLPTMEITFRTAAAKDSMKKIAATCPDILLGAGTVLSVEQVKMAVDCGARYIVSPGINREVVDYCLGAGIPVTPGVATPTDIQAAVDLGLDVVKFFPAEASGGLEYLKAISAPFRQMRFIPTGGIDQSTVLSYLQHASVLACGGSWMVKADLITAKRFDEIERLADRAVATMLGLHLVHVGINHPDPAAATRTTNLLARLLHLPIRDGESSLFAGAEYELLKSPGAGTHGHIAIGTHFLDRAAAFFARGGVRTKEETRNVKNGKTASIYLDIDLAGFAIHLLQE
jgi:2-dehydro-3-deoxyphosphogluconate aldolase/(4S)-4-hydroxy-2-oxoglutarate aldolase